MTRRWQHLKDTVEAKSPSLHLLDGLLTACVVYTLRGFPFTVTSMEDSQHGLNSLHYSGNAADIRTRHVPVSQLPALHRALVDALGRDYDVVLEKTHIHIEYDPKTPRVKEA